MYRHHKHSDINQQDKSLFSGKLNVIREKLIYTETSQIPKVDLQRIIAWIIIDYFNTM